VARLIERGRSRLIPTSVRWRAAWAGLLAVTALTVPPAPAQAVEEQLVASSERAWPTSGASGSEVANWAPAVSAPAAVAPAGPAAAGGDRHPRLHTVRRGETLWGIARAYLGPAAAQGRIATEVAQLEALNASRIRNPDVILPGQQLLLPPHGQGRGALEAGAGYGRVGGARRVRAVQRLLRRLGYRPGPVDGRFGANTATAVRRFQRAEALRVDGIVGPRTGRALRARAGELTETRSGRPAHRRVSSGRSRPHPHGVAPVLARPEPALPRPPVEPVTKRGDVLLWIIAYSMALGLALVALRLMRPRTPGAPPGNGSRRGPTDIAQPVARPPRGPQQSASLSTYTQPDPRVSVVIPALNEAESLPYVLSGLPQGLHEVILVDGGSNDGTTSVAQLLLPGVNVITQTRRGKGNALACGFARCRGDIVVAIDADGSNDPGEIPRFIAALQSGASFAKGSRFLPGGGSSDITLRRRLGNRALNRLVNVLFGTSYTDLCYGYNAFWRHCLPQLRLDCDGFEVETLMNIRLAKAGLPVVEVPSFEAPRISGESKLNAGRDGWRVLRTILGEWLSLGAAPANQAVEAIRGGAGAGRRFAAEVAPLGPRVDGERRRSPQSRPGEHAWVRPQ
jgi:hypothetical protein